MNLQDNLLPLLIGVAVWALIMYIIISSAVKSANKEFLYYHKIVYRTHLFNLRKAGYSMGDISAIHASDDNHFWEWLTKSRSPEEEKAYPDELEKIKAYQEGQQ